MSQHKNPYNENKHYGKLFAFMQKAKVYTRADLINQAMLLGLSDKVRKGAHVSPAQATVTVLLSPRDVKQEGLRGDPRGNMSAQGHVYYNELLNRSTGAKQRFRLRWRSEVLARHARKVEVKQEKSQKSKKAVKPVKKSKVSTVKA